MNIIKRRLTKTFTYNRKQANKSIELETLVDKSLKSISEQIDNIVLKYMSKIDFQKLELVSKYCNKHSGNIILTKARLVDTLTQMLTQVVSDWLNTDNFDSALYRGEYFSLFLTTNKKDKHIIVILPNFDVL